MAILQDIMRARYSSVRLIRINFLIRLNSLETIPKGLRSFNSVPLVFKSLFPAYYSKLANSFMTHSESRIFWWEDFIKLGELL